MTKKYALEFVAAYSDSNAIGRGRSARGREALADLGHECIPSAEERLSLHNLECLDYLGAKTYRDTWGMKAPTKLRVIDLHPDADIHLQLPNGEFIIIQYRLGEVPAIDVIMPTKTIVHSCRLI